MARRQRRDLSVFESSCHLPACLPHTAEASHCPFDCWTSSRKAVNTNFYSLWFDPTRNRTRVYRFSSRRSIHSTTDRLKLGAPPPDPGLWCVWVTLVCSIRLLMPTFTLFGGLNPLPLAKSWFCAKHGFWSFTLQCLLSHKKFLFLKFQMTSLHVICPPFPNQKSWVRLRSTPTVVAAFCINSFHEGCKWPV